eukprot:1159392-Pelagomonas_calceolata.AAC.4
MYQQQAREADTGMHASALAHDPAAAAVAAVVRWAVVGLAVGMVVEAVQWAGIAAAAAAAVAVAAAAIAVLNWSSCSLDLCGTRGCT